MTTVVNNDAQPGRSCPLDYRYTPARIAQSPSIARGAVYAAGGLYGNLGGAASLSRLLATEPCNDPELIFNGDFHWFDAEPIWFAEVEAFTARHTRLRGNVETEFSRIHEGGAGCGCAYPDAVDEGVVERSNRIEQALAETAMRHSNGQDSWSGLPMFVRRQVGDTRVAIVHGDAWSLAGWGFAQGLAAPMVQQACKDADVQLFLSSHTCDAFDLLAGDGTYGVLNNGCAGMPNLPGHEVGLVCRVGLAPHPAAAVRRWQFGKVWVEWLPLDCSAPVFTERFLQRWPAGSDANASYWTRIQRGIAAG